METEKNQQLKTEAIVGVIKSNIQQENYENALELIKTQYQQHGADSALKKRFEFYYFLTYWKSADHHSAEKWCQQYLSNNAFKQEKARIYFTEFRKSYKIPKLAMALNLVLPGSGFVYTKDYKKGLKSFGLNGVLAASTIYTAAQYYPAYALVAVGSWWVRYYAGGIVNGHNSAIYHNRIQKDIWKDKIFALMSE